MLWRQVVNAMKAVKLSAWEGPFEDHILAARKSETDKILLFRSLQQTALQIGRVNPIIGAFTTFLYLGIRNQEWEAAEVFAVLSIFHSCRMGMIIVPMSMAVFWCKSTTMRP